MQRFLRIEKGFTLVEVLVVLVVVIILAGGVLLIFNPIDSIHKARDAKRLDDFRVLRQAIDYTLGEESLNNAVRLCGENPAPCSGNSFPPNANFRKSDGNGWIHVQFPPLIIAVMPILPIDPLNTVDYSYIYYSDGVHYELDLRLESANGKKMMENDGGDNPNKYELGTDLFLLH